jgi:hypothetical protein
MTSCPVSVLNMKRVLRHLGICMLYHLDLITHCSLFTPCPGSRFRSDIGTLNSSALTVSNLYDKHE